MKGFRIKKGTLVHYRGKAAEVTVPAGVIEIGERAFRDCGNLQRVVLPEGVHSIGERAFENCPQLQSVTLAPGVQRIGGSAFSGCTALRHVVLPESVQSIGEKAFRGCENLQEITPAGEETPWWMEDGLLVDPDRKTLLWCSRERTDSCTVPEGVRCIGEGVFAKCAQLRRITLPNGLREISSEAFSGCEGLEEVTVPKGVVTIGEDAFCGCTSLRRITLSKGLQEIGDWAFYDCGQLQELIVPEGVERIGEEIAGGCAQLERILLPQSLRELEPLGCCDHMHLTELWITERPGRRPGPLLSEAWSLQQILYCFHPPYLIAPQLPCALLEGKEDRRTALLGFVHAQEEGLAYADEKNWHDCALQEKEWLLSKAAEDRSVRRWLRREKLLDGEEGRTE